MLTITLENKGIINYKTNTDKTKHTLTNISRSATGKKYYAIPVPSTCPIITDLRKKEENRYVPSRDYFNVKTEEIRIYDIKETENNKTLSLPSKWEGRNVLLIPYENDVTVSSEYDYILEKETKSNNIYANQSTIGEMVYCCTDEEYQLYSNNTISIFNPRHNITLKKVNKQRKVFVEKGTKEVVIFR